MPERRNRDDAIAADLERVAAALRDGEAAVYGYDVQREPSPTESGAVSYPGGWFEFRFERSSDHPDRSTGTRPQE